MRKILETALFVAAITAMIAGFSYAEEGEAQFREERVAPYIQGMAERDLMKRSVHAPELDD